jgi:hypothetical protein
MMLSDEQKELFFKATGLTEKKVTRMLLGACEDDDSDMIEGILKLGILKEAPQIIGEDAVALMLRIAAHENDLDAIKALVAVGCDVHVHDECALWEAASYGHLDIVKYLVERKRANITKIISSTAYRNVQEVEEYLDGQLKKMGINPDEAYLESIQNK